MHNHSNYNDDSWADDVSLIYPENGWKPDDGELTMLEIEGVNTPPKKTAAKETASKDAPGEKITTKETASVDVPKTATDTETASKRNPFRMFMILWLGCLSITIAVLLGYFYEFLCRYEDAYQASRPYHDMDYVLEQLETRNLPAVYNMMTVKPTISEWETTDNVYRYMDTLLGDAQFDYTETPSHLEDYPEYYITADGYIIATVALMKSQTESLAYDFPVWYISSFEFYTEPQYDFRIEAPENCTVSINGIPLSDTYCYEDSISMNDAAYMAGYADLPDGVRYYGDGLYEAPVITAYNCFGEEAPVTFNTSTGIYEVGFGTNSSEEAALQAYAIEVVSAYANYISNDLPEDGLDNYFVEGCEILEMIKAGTSRQYFAAHSTPTIQNEEVLDFILYSEDAFYCEVYLEQNMPLTYYNEPEIIPITGKFYFVRIDGQWRVCNIRY